MENIHVEPSVAKEVALFFCNAVGADLRKRGILPRTINTAKALLGEGYSKEEIFKVIDWTILTKPNIYSLEYIRVTMEDTLARVERMETSSLHKKLAKEATIIAESEVKEFEYNEGRNEGKLEKLNTQSSFGKKRNFDLPW